MLIYVELELVFVMYVSCYTLLIQDTFFLQAIWIGAYCDLQYLHCICCTG